MTHIGQKIDKQIYIQKKDRFIKKNRASRLEVKDEDVEGWYIGNRPTKGKRDG